MKKYKILFIYIYIYIYSFGVTMESGAELEILVWGGQG